MKTKKLISRVVALLAAAIVMMSLAGCTIGEKPDDSIGAYIELGNESGRELKELNVTYSSSPSWGKNIVTLAGLESVPPHMYLHITVANNALQQYLKIRIKDADNMVYEFRDVNPTYIKEDTCFYLMNDEATGNLYIQVELGDGQKIVLPADSASRALM